MVNWKPGATLEDCIDEYIRADINFKREHKPKSDQEIQRFEGYPFLERLCVKIENPEFERIPENQNKKTFDRIRIVVWLNSSMFNTRQELIECVRKNRKDIDEMVLRKLETNRAFLKYNVPIGFLRLDAIMFGNQHDMVYIFEPKKFD